MSVTAETPPSKRRFTRELTTLVAAPLMLWIIGWAAHPIYLGMIALVASLALFEFLELGRHKGYPVHRVISILLLLILLSAFVLEQLSVEVGVFAILLVIPALYVFTARDIDEALPASAVCVLGTLYIGMLSGALIRLRMDFPLGSKLIFFLLIAVWSGDAGAYYIGSKFGKRRLSPLISPKKSVEGLMGGLITSLIAAAIVHFTFFPEFPLGHAMFCALILSCTGVIGDLAESLWKRSAAVKDSGTLIPGHGGFLDRFDSILFTAPILYSYWFLLVHHFHIV